MKWHSVLRRMPDSDTDVLIHCPVSSEPVWLAYFDAERESWIYPNGATCEHTVTHWADLPEPPDGK